MARFSLTNTLLAVVLGLGPVSQAISDQNADSPILAQRGEGSVSVEDFYARMSQIPERDHNSVLSDPRRMQSILDNLLLLKQLTADAREAGLDQDSLVAARMLKSAESTLANIWLENYIDQQPMADYEALARETYLVQKENFMSGKRVDVTHLLISSRERSVDEAKSMAEELLAAIEADPSGFEDLIAEHSEDPSAPANQGSFRKVKKGDMVPQFEEAAFSLEEPGDFSGLVQSAFGFHIIRLDGIYEPEQMTFDAVKEDLMGRERHNHRERIRNEYLSGLSGMTVDTNNEEMQRILKEYFKDEIPEEDLGSTDIE
jgi:peptidyl-prolyl cis-trans isomerase C